MPTVLLAGASGDLGARVARALLARGADVRALTRPGSGAGKRAAVTELGASVVEAGYDDAAGLRRAAEGADVVVSTLNGLRDVLIDGQTQLLEAAVAAGVPRFVPSDFSADYRRVAPGSNRNFEIRRDFARVLDRAPIRATSVLNGAFTDLLTGAMPVVQEKLGRILYWHDADQPLDFTTRDDAAAFTADAALDADAPRYLEIAGDVVTPRDLAATMTELTGRSFRTTWAGPLALIGTAAKVPRGAGAVPGLAGDAVRLQLVQRHREARAAGQRPLRAAHLDDGAGGARRPLTGAVGRAATRARCRCGGDSEVSGVDGAAAARSA